MYLTWLADTSLYETLTHIDADLAATARWAGCRRCGGVVHSARRSAQAAQGRALARFVALRPPPGDDSRGLRGSGQPRPS